MSLCGACLYAVEGETNIDDIDKLQLRGLADIKGNLYASLHDSVSGFSFWLTKGATRQDVMLLEVDTSTKSVTLLVQDAEIQLSLLKSNTHSTSKLFFEGNHLTQKTLSLNPYNALMLKKHKELAAKTRNPRNGTYLRDNRVQKVIESFILENPSHHEWGQFIDGMTDYIDMDTFLGIRFIGVEGRNSTNTAGWGNKKNIDYKALREALARGASLRELNAIVKKKGHSI